MFINTSQDLLHILLGISAFLVAAFISILLFYLIMIIRDFRNISKSLKTKIELMDNLIMTAKNILETIQEKLDHWTKYYGLLIDLVTKIIEHLKERKKENDRQNLLTNKDQE